MAFQFEGSKTTTTGRGSAHRLAPRINPLKRLSGMSTLIEAFKPRHQSVCFMVGMILDDADREPEQSLSSASRFKHRAHWLDAQATVGND